MHPRCAQNTTAHATHTHTHTLTTGFFQVGPPPSRAYRGVTGGGGQYPLSAEEGAKPLSDGEIPPFYDGCPPDPHYVLKTSPPNRTARRAVPPTPVDALRIRLQVARALDHAPQADCPFVVRTCDDRARSSQMTTPVR